MGRGLPVRYEPSGCLHRLGTGESILWNLTAVVVVVVDAVVLLLLFFGVCVGCVCVCERERESERLCVHACACVSPRVPLCAYVRAGERAQKLRTQEIKAQIKAHDRV